MEYEINHWVQLTVKVSEQHDMIWLDRKDENHKFISCFVTV